MCLAVPGKVISIEGENSLEKTGKIDFSGIQKEVNLAYVPEAKIGDYVIVHAGFAISQVDEEEAKKTLEYMDEIDKLYEGSPDSPL